MERFLPNLEYKCGRRTHPSSRYWLTAFVPWSGSLMISICRMSKKSIAERRRTREGWQTTVTESSANEDPRRPLIVAEIEAWSVQ